MQKEEAMQPFTVSIIPYFGTLYAKFLTYFMFLIQARDLMRMGVEHIILKCSCISKFIIGQDNLLLGFRTESRYVC